MHSIVKVLLLRSNKSYTLRNMYVIAVTSVIQKFDFADQNRHT